MKKILFASIALLFFNFQFSFFNSAQAQVKWHTIEEASKAQIGEKYYFIDFYTDWCGYCKKYRNKTCKRQIYCFR